MVINKNKIFIFILLFWVLILLPQNVLAALSCADKYPGDGHCVAASATPTPTSTPAPAASACPEGESEDTATGLCSGSSKCCHRYGAPAAVTLQVPLFTYTKTENIMDYIATLYKFISYIIVPFVIVVIIIAGIMWVLAGGDRSIIKAAKDRIKYALIGLLIVIFSYFILQMLGLTNLSNYQVQFVQPIIEEPDPFNETTEPSQAPIQTKGQACFYREFGDSAAAVRSQMTTVPCPGLGHSLRVHQKAAAAYKAACAKIPVGLKTACGTPVKADGTQCWRMINTGHGPSTTSRSLHSWGTAVDINPFQCKLCDNASRSKCGCKPVVPQAVINAFKSTPGFRWGGDYKNKCDNMHFEWLGPCAKGR